MGTRSEPRERNGRRPGSAATGGPRSGSAIWPPAGFAIAVPLTDVGPFAEQPIDHRTLSTQPYSWVAGTHHAVPSGLVGVIAGTGRWRPSG